MKTSSSCPSLAAQRLLDEGLVLVVKAASDVGISISSKTAIRWCLNGVRGVRLESVKIRGRRMTSRPAFARFVAATQPKEADPSAPSPVAMNTDDAEQVLRAFGLGRDDLHHRSRRPEDDVRRAP
ncbi:MAG: DUF1580 domain-containing protein [Planctomycetota bacterium]